MRVPPPAYSPTVRPTTGIANVAAIAEYAGTLGEAVGSVVDAGGLAPELGGDCSIVLGPLLALSRRTSGLLFLDGHADFAHPDDEPRGEGAAMQLAFARGRRPAGFGLPRPVAEEPVAVPGYRVHGDGTDTNRSTTIWEARSTPSFPAVRRDAGAALNPGDARGRLMRRLFAVEAPRRCRISPGGDNDAAQVVARPQLGAYRVVDVEA